MTPMDEYVLAGEQPVYSEPRRSAPRGDTSALREALAQATPGPWREDEDGFHDLEAVDEHGFGEVIGRIDAEEDVALIVAMHTALPGLLDRLAHAEHQVARVRSMRAVATDATVTTAAIDWALDGSTTTSSTTTQQGEPDA